MTVKGVHNNNAVQKTTSTKVADAGSPQNIAVPVGRKSHNPSGPSGFSKIKNDIGKDLASGILVRDDKFNWKKFQFEDRVTFNSKKYEEKFGEKLTYGEISKRYGLAKGDLKKENGLCFGTYQMSKGRGDDMSQYYPDEIGGSEVTIPFKSVEKYLDALGK